MRKSAIPVNRFRLSQIGEVISPNSDGWFSSKIETLRSVSDTAEVITPLSQFHHCLARNGWSVLTTMPRTQDGKVFVQIFSETEETTMVDLEHYTARLKDNYLTEEKKSLPTETIPRDASAMFRSLKIKSTTNQVSPKSKLKSLPGLSKAKSSTKKFSPPKCATPLKRSKLKCPQIEKEIVEYHAGL